MKTNKDSDHLQSTVRVITVINNHGASQAITVLRNYESPSVQMLLSERKGALLTVMRMVPERPRLVRNSEIVIERITRYDGALSDTDRAISIGASFLEHAVPVLHVL
jgi:hypothetical protein